MSTRTPLIAGNWKMHNNHLEANKLVQAVGFSLRETDFDAVEVVVLPPFTNLRTVQTTVDADKLRLAYGAQDISPYDSGAYTGEVSGPMLAKLGCDYALAGHSERRQYHREDDALVNAKVKAALRHGITPLLCLGEGLDVREAGEQVPHTMAQLDAALADLTDEQAAGMVIAYEPVWAIGTGRVATPEDAQEVCAALRSRVGELHGAQAAESVRVLYGGSVKPDNIAGIMARPDIDGALVGGVSLKYEDFAKVVRYRELS